VAAVLDPFEEFARIAVGGGAFAQFEVAFCVSQTSVVSTPRTARAFSRAAVRQDTIDEGLAVSPTMKASTFFASRVSYLASKAPCSSEMPSMARHVCSASNCDCGNIAVCNATSSMRAVFSARSV
jgi:hypothetical protein